MRSVSLYSLTCFTPLLKPVCVVQLGPAFFAQSSYVVSVLSAAQGALTRKQDGDRLMLMVKFDLSAAQTEALRDAIRDNVMNGTLPRAEHLTCSDQELKGGESEARKAAASSPS